MSDITNLGSLLADISRSEVNETVKAEDFSGEKIDWNKIFFEPEPGKTYIIKFLPNLDSLSSKVPGGVVHQNIVHRAYYKDLPDPERRGKTFAYTASAGFDKGKNLLLDLFFDLNDAKKSGDVVAEKKLEKYLSRKQQACCKIQIIKAPDKDLIGKIKLFRFHTYGANAIIANLINQKLNPSASDIENGFEKENIFDIFESRTLMITCEESTYQGQKGRDFSKSRWSEKKSGAFVIMPDDFEGDKIHKFSKEDIDDSGVKASVNPYINELASQISNEDISIFKWFEYKEVGDPRLSEEDNERLRNTIRKVEIVREKIRTCSLEELAKLGSESSNSDDKGSDKNADLLKDSIPDDEVPVELKGMESGVKTSSNDGDNKKVTDALEGIEEDF